MVLFVDHEVTVRSACLVDPAASVGAPNIDPWTAENVQGGAQINEEIDCITKLHDPTFTYSTFLDALFNLIL